MGLFWLLHLLQCRSGNMLKKIPNAYFIAAPEVDMAQFSKRLSKQLPSSPSQVIGKIPNPCVRNCCLDDEDVCLGCGRMLSEITGWHGLSDTDKERVLELAAGRRQAKSLW